MGVYDHRTVSENQVSYYVFNDLRFQQNDRHDFDIFRFDTLEEAMSKFRQIPPDMTPALGMHRDARSELDLLHRREGDAVLVTDYLNFPKWRTDPDVQKAVDTACAAFDVQWQMDSRCLNTTILIPLERGFECLPNRVFSDKNLRLADPAHFGHQPSIYSAINEGYVEGEGWLAYPALRQNAERFGFHDPHCVKVRQFNINYIDTQGRTGQADISPMDLQILLERHIFQHGEPSAVKDAIKRLSEEISELLVSSDPERTTFAETLRKELSEGRIETASEALTTMRDFGEADHQIAVATRLLSRVQGIAQDVRTILPDLCYTVLESSGELVCVKNGEEGYFRTDYNTDDPAKNRQLADYLNTRLDITPAQVSAMTFGSMFGWHTPGADPKSYAHKALDQQIIGASSRRQPVDLSKSTPSKERGD